VRVLRTIYFAQGKHYRLRGPHPSIPGSEKDCHSLATLHIARRMPDEALGWVERGMQLRQRLA